MQILNLSYHEDAGRCLSNFWKDKIEVPVTHITITENTWFDSNAEIIKISENLERFCTKSTLLVAPDPRCLNKLYENHEYLKDLRVAWYQGEPETDWTGSDYMITASCRIQTILPRLSTLIMPKLMKLEPTRRIERDFNHFATFINHYPTWPSYADFLKIKEKLKLSGIKLEWYGLQEKDGICDYSNSVNDVTVMRKIGGAVHIKSSDATSNAVAKSLAVGTPVFMDAHSYFCGGHEQLRGIVVRDSLDSLCEAILQHSREPSILVLEAEQASKANQTVSTRKINEAKSWIAAALAN